jgi:poly(hydroxyalkanoate) depolymerase family esterase
MRRYFLAVAVVSLGLLLARGALAASATQVSRSTWAGSVSLPSYLQMYIYVPAKVAANPPIVVSAHSCMGSASGQQGDTPKTLAAADSLGFIVIYPDNPGQNCWDVGSTKSLTHDGGGDTQGVALMVKYALMKYNGDPKRVYIFGGSSGGMMTQAMLAVYPDLFRAGSARAGVPAGCWAQGYDSSMQWSNSCANGQVSKTAQQWGDGVRMMYPSYTGHRPRVQTMQGESDTTISYNNTGEAIKEWTNVLNLPTTPTSTDKAYKPAGSMYSYDRQFWSNACGYTVLQVWSAPGGTHSMPYEEADILKFFGLDTAMAADPEPDCSGSTGAGGVTGGSAGAGGQPAAGGAGGHPAGGHGGMAAGTGGVPATGGTGGTMVSTGGISGTGGVPGTGGIISATGGTIGTGGVIATGGNGGSPPEAEMSSNGCSCATGASGGGVLSTLALAIAGLAAGRLTRRRKR